MDEDSFLQNITNIMNGFMLSCRNDASYTVVTISSGFERIYGHNRSDFMAQGANYAELVHPDDREHLSRIVDSALAVGSSWQLQYRLKTKDGQWRHVFETGSGRRNGGNKTEYLDCMIIDFAQMNELVGKLAAGNTAISTIAQSVQKVVVMLDAFRMLSFNARIEAANTNMGTGFDEVARQIADLANVGDSLAKDITTQLRCLTRVLQA